MKAPVIFDTGNLQTDGASKRMLFSAAAAVAIVVAYGLVIAFFSISGFPASISVASKMPYVYDRPVGEDGYYMLTVAWSIAEGRGIVGNFDQPVTGIQPLATFIFALIAKTVMLLDGGKEDFVRAIVAFGSINLAVFSGAIGLLGARICPVRSRQWSGFGMAVIASALSFYIFRTFTYGLETGIYLTMVALVVLYSFDFLDGSNSNPFSPKTVIFGLLVGLTGLARIDFGVVFLFVALYCCTRRPATLARFMVAGAIAFAMVAPWLFYVWLVSGSPMPSSGPAQSSLINLREAPGRVSALTMAIVQNLVPWIYSGGRWDLSLASCAILVFLLLRLRRDGGIADRGVVLVWFSSFMGLAMVYLVFFWAGHFYPRYTAPLMVIAIPVAANAILMGRRSSRGILHLKEGIPLGLAMVFVAFSLVSMHSGRIGPHTVSAGYVSANYNGVQKVGAFQSGVIGFVNANVVNLDGKVNFDVVHFVRGGNIDEYLRRERDIEVLIDSPGYIHGLVSDRHIGNEWDRCPKKVPNSYSICFVRRR